MAKTYGVGLVGVSPPASWAVVAHLPALRARADRFRIVGLANSTAESARRAAAACDIEQSFDSVADLCSSPDVDIVVVTVKAGLHAGIVEQALAAGKHVFCEWPLGRDYAETVRLAALAEGRDLTTVCGSQAGAHPVVRHAAALVGEGWLGRPLFATVVADGGSWGALIPQNYAYSTEASEGATIISVPVGHTLVGLQEIFGPITSIFAERSSRRNSTRIIETGEIRAMNVPDNVMLGIVFESGLPMSMHYRAGVNRGGGFRCEIIGEDGELHITGEPFGAIEMIDLALTGARTADEAMSPIPVPQALLPDPSQGIVPDNVMALYDRLYEDLETGSRTAPSFADAARNHRLLRAIERSATEGRRIVVADI